MEVSGQLHATTALAPKERDLRYPLGRRLDGPQDSSGRRERKKNIVPTETRTSTPLAVQPVASTDLHKCVLLIKRYYLVPLWCA
jgi:hypothetical protein